MKTVTSLLRNVATQLRAPIQTISIKSGKRFARAGAQLLLLTGFFLGVLAVTGASPTPGPISETIGRRPIGLVIPSTLGAYPTTTIPLSSDATVTPDAAPTNIMSMNVSSSTNFNGTLEGNPGTGVVRVTDARPAGIYTVTVAGFSSTGVRTSTTFTLTVTTPATCPTVTFAPAANFGGTPGFPDSIAVGDFNGDGKQDLAATNSLSQFYHANVSILLGDGAGNFSVPTNFFVPDYDYPISIAVGDFNGDGKQDLVTANQSNNSSNNVSIFLGHGDGNFSGATNFGAGNDSRWVAVGDFNGDGNQDVVVANFGSNNVSVLLGGGGADFFPATNFVTGTQPISVAVGDFNGDGKQDLAVANLGSNNMSILLGDGGGNFSGPMNFGNTYGFPDSIAVGDFNGDGKQDIALGNSYGVLILLGDGAGNLSNPTNFHTASVPVSLAVGDFNGDGKQDLASGSLDQVVSILLRFCPTDECMVCHKHATTITLPCGSLELRRHLDHGDTRGQCPSN